MNYNFINTAYLEMVSGGSREITEELISIFRQQAEEFYRQMTEFNETGNHEELGLLAHKAKSSVAIMGMEELASQLKELEINARNSADTGSYQNVIAKFQFETSEAIKELDYYISTL
jgi:HPt (histidine-containing phosphotransfer) domain-containing protein